MHQHTSDAQLTLQELREMISSDREAFSNRVMSFATSPYLLKLRSRLVAMVDTLGLPTGFFFTQCGRSPVARACSSHLP